MDDAAEITAATVDGAVAHACPQSTPLAAQEDTLKTSEDARLQPIRAQEPSALGAQPGTSGPAENTLPPGFGDTYSSYYAAAFYTGDDDMLRLVYSWAFCCV
jgi:hypothetical protein